jgi:hypothetical protein
VSLNYEDTPSTPSKVIRVREPDDAGADHNIVVAAVRGG